MTSISIGTTRTNIRVSEPATNNENIKLRGITWNENVNRTESSPPQDKANITRRDNGSIPSGNELPDLFANNNYDNNIPPQQNYDQEPPQKPVKQSSDGSEMATGIGMAVGGVGGAIIGGKYGFKKLGIALGVAIGGFIGNKVGQ